MNHTLKEWIHLSEGTTLAQAAIAQQAGSSHRTEAEVRETMHGMLTVMREAVQEGLDSSLRSFSGMVGGQASLLMQRRFSGQALCGSLLGKAQAYALATAECNACMGKIVAAPTAGACGILPGAVLALCEERGYSDEQAVEALFVGAAIAESIAMQACIAGAEGGCQAECGSAAAMAAAAIVYLEGGTAQQSADAAAFSLMNLLGLVCDPVDGLVEIPCVYRNVGASGVAFTSADMVLAGIRCPIDPDEVILAMKEVGDSLPAALRETGDGGCAACPCMKH